MPEKDESTGLTDAQLEIMQVVWDHGEITVGDVWKELSARRTLARNTVQTMMTRLEERGWLVRRAIGPIFLYRAAKPRKTTARQAVKKLVNTLFAGSAEGLVATLLEGRTLDPAEAQRIQEMIAKAAAKKEKKS